MTDADGDPFDRAATAHAEGRLDDAERGYEACLDDDPGDAVAMALLGAVRTAQGRPREGCELLDRSLKLDPENEVAWLHLGIARQQLGEHTSAIEALERARVLQTPFPETVPPLLASLAAVRRFEEIFALTDDIRREDFAWRVSRLARADALLEMGRLDEAEEASRELLEIDPNDADAASRLIARCLAEPHPDQSLDRFRRLAEARPNDLRVLSAFAEFAGRIGRLDDAERLWSRVAEVDPETPTGHYEKGRVLAVLGRVEEAVACFERVLELRPGHSDTWLALSFIKTFRSDDPRLVDVDAIETNLAGRPENERCNLHFAIARIRDGLGEHDRAFEHLLEASKLHHRAVPSDIDSHEGVTRTIVAGASSEAWQRLHRRGSDAGPILVVGMPRSGTTLTEQILSRHPDVHGAGELAVAANAVNEIGLARILDEVARCDGSAMPPSIRTVADRYLSTIPRPIAPAGRICDKQPQNYQALGPIAVGIPDATIVHCVRDPRDVAVSCFQAYFGEQPWSFDLRDIGRCLRSHEELMRHWHACFPGRIVTVRYEDLVTSPEIEIPRLLDRVGLEFDERCLHPEESDRAVNTASIAQVRRPINRGSIGRWRRYERHLGPLFEEIRDLIPDQSDQSSSRT
ncbi:MAG: sulfotransferase [Phycisphaerales bacterium]